MFVVCKFPDNQKFILFDKEEINPEDFNLDKEKEITFEELIADYNLLPILSLNDFLLRTLGSRYRTDSHKLGEINIDSWCELESEYNLINAKKSKLSRSLRDLVQKRYNEIINV